MYFKLYDNSTKDEGHASIIRYRNESESFVHLYEKGNLIKFMISLVYIELPLRFQRYSVCHRSIEETNKLECALTFFINEVIILIFHLGLIPTLRIY